MVKTTAWQGKALGKTGRGVGDPWVKLATSDRPIFPLPAMFPLYL